MTRGASHLYHCVLAEAKTKHHAVFRLRTAAVCITVSPARDLGLARRRPRSTEGLLGGATAPRNDDSTFQSEAVLIRIIVADLKGALIAEAGVEILQLGRAQRDFFA